MAAGAPGRTRPRTLVLGASGHLGNAVVRELLATGHAVTAARRGRTAARNLAELPVAHVLGDAEDPATLDRWVADHELVVDAAAPYPLSLFAPPAAADATVRRATTLIDAIIRHGARLVHIGSFVTELGTDDTGRPREPAQRLEAELHPYFVAKRAGQAVLAAAARRGAPVASVHPTVCLGPWDSHPGALSIIPSVLAGRLPVVPSRLINVIDVRDVARGVVAAATAGSRGPLLLTGHNIGVPELCAWIGELAGCAVRTRAAPPAILRAAAWVAELATLGAAMPPPLLPTLLVLRQAPLPVGAAQRALGVIPRPLSVTLRDAIAWYRGDPLWSVRDGL